MGEIAKREDAGQVIPQSPDTIMAVIARAASDPGTDVTKLERLLGMFERINAKNAEAAFNSAMAQMQAELPVIAKSGEIRHNGKLISTYARFEDINEAAKPVLQKHGFAVSFKTDTSDGKVKVIGILTHRDGHRETTDMVLPVDASGAKNAVQAVGSSVQYGKRYVMCALLNISTGEDDDGSGSVTQEGHHANSKPSAAKDANATLPAYPDKQFDQNLPTWLGLIDAGKQTAASIIAKVSSRYTLSEAQKNKLLNPDQQAA